MIRVWLWPLAPAVHSTRKRRSASCRPGSWFAGDSFSAAATGPAGHAIASAAPSSNATARTSDRHEHIGISPVFWAGGRQRTWLANLHSRRFRGGSRIGRTAAGEVFAETRTSGLELFRFLAETGDPRSVHGASSSEQWGKTTTCRRK